MLYHEAVGHVINDTTSNLTSMEAASRVAMMYNINIAKIDRPMIKASINNHPKVAKFCMSMSEVLYEHE